MSVLDKIVERAWDELTQEHDITLANLNLTDNDCFGIRVSEKIFPADHPDIENDALKKETSEILSDGGKKKVFWVQTKGILDAKGRLSTEFPVGGATMSLGFGVSGLL